MSDRDPRRVNPAPWTHGRPVRGRTGRPVLPTVGPTDDLGAPPAALAWIEAARHESSSIANLYVSAASLVALGAPDELVDRTLAAADDERHHVEICLALARRAGARDPRLDDDVLGLAGHRRRHDGLVATAVASLLDGVVGESFLARRCELAAERTPSLRAALGRMAADEARHAELAVDVVAWCTRRRPWVDADLRLALGALASATPRSDVLGPIGDDERAEHGLCTSLDEAEAWSATLVAADELVAGVRAAHA